MAAQRSASDKEQGSLLSPAQKCTCQDFAAQKIGLASQRAVALLAMDCGATQLKACASSGLTIGQIRYLLNIFRRKGMAIFPADQKWPLGTNASIDIPTTEGLLIVGEKTTVSPQVVEKKLKTASSKDEKKHKAKMKEAKKKEVKKKEKKQKKKEKAKTKMGKKKNKK